MRNEQTVKDIYKIAGMLEMLTCMQDHPLTSGMVAELVDAVDKLELIGAAMMNIDIDIVSAPCTHDIRIDFFDDAHSIRLHGAVEKVVKAHEGTEEPTPEAHTDDQ